MTEQRVLAIVLAIVALSHVYLLYPLPGTRVEEIARSELQKYRQSTKGESTKSDAIATEHEILANLELDALETSLWQGWIIVLFVVFFGILSAITVLNLRSLWWRAIALAFCAAYLTMFWIETVSPLNDVGGYLDFQIKTISSLIRLGQFSRLLMVIQQLLSPVALLLVVAYVLARTSSAAVR